MYVLKMVMGVDVRLCCDKFVDFDTRGGFSKKGSIALKGLK